MTLTLCRCGKYDEIQSAFAENGRSLQMRYSEHLEPLQIRKSCISRPWECVAPVIQHPDGFYAGSCRDRVSAFRKKAGFSPYTRQDGCVDGHSIKGIERTLQKDRPAQC